MLIRLVNKCSSTHYKRHDLSMWHLSRRINSSAPSINIPSIEPKWQTKWQQHWNTHHLTNNDNLTMLFPPPNITGSLHCGHALTISIQDVLVRWHAINGRSLHWICGTDHAGIATQSVVEKMLLKNNLVYLFLIISLITSPNRHILGRDEFIDQIWKWKSIYGNKINLQLAKIGPLLNANREPYFTMDAPRSRIVRDAFVTLYERNLIYKDTRLVHWCPFLSSVISDIEVDSLQIDKPTSLHLPNGRQVTVGLLDSFRYKLVDSQNYISVSTTRLETVLGDVGLAVHPNDSRYTHLINKLVEHPLIPNRHLQIVADTGVDPDFGTGVVKISPAHDSFDYQLAKTHNLGPPIETFCPLGRIANLPNFPPDLIGLDRFDARKLIKTKLESLNLYEGSQPHAMRVPVCSRTRDIIEPRLVPQWYIRCKPMANNVLAQLKDHAISVGSTYSNESSSHVADEFAQMLENMQDWCISRQLWWGHRIPAYYQPLKHSQFDSVCNWVVGPECPNNNNGNEDMWVQDQDVLDTWFSSALLPISATNADFNSGNLVHYPTEILETGHDILFFWVARMAMLCTELTGQVPFRRVLVHGMVRDAEGRKMSKSLGNVIDPLDVIHGRSLKDMVADLQTGNLPPAEVSRSTKLIERQFPNGIPACGADALRLSLLELASSRQINLDVSKVITKHHFTNKLFNLARFASNYITDDHTHPEYPNDTSSVPDQWILHGLKHVYAKWNEYIDQGQVGRATQLVLEFILSNVSDTYIEFVKHGYLQNMHARRTLMIVMQYILVMVHPMAPHVSAELYQQIFPNLPNLPWSPKLPTLDMITTDKSVQDFDAIWKIVETCRRRLNSAQELRLCKSQDTNVLVVTDSIQLHGVLKHFQQEITKLGRVHLLSDASLLIVHQNVLSQKLSEIFNNASHQHLAEYMVKPGLSIQVFQPSTGNRTSIPDAHVRELPQHRKEINRITKQMHKIQSMMAATTYVAKVPEQVRAQNQSKLVTYRARLKELGALT